MFKIETVAADGTILDMDYFMRELTSVQLETYHSDAVDRFGTDIVLRFDAVRYVEMGRPVSRNEAKTK